MSKEQLGKMDEAIHSSLPNIKSINYCLHQETENCPCRKPKIGLANLVCGNGDMDCDTTFIIGDSWRDVAFGISLNIRVLLIERKDQRFDHRADSLLIKYDKGFRIENLHEAARLIPQRLKIDSTYD